MNSQIDTETTRTLKSDIKRGLEFVADHKYKLMGGVAIALLAAGGITQHASAEHSPSTPSAISSEKIEVPSIADLEKAATTPARLDEIVGTPMVDNGIDTPRIYDQAKKQLSDLGLDNPVNFNAVDLTSKHVSSENLIQPDAVFFLADHKFSNGEDQLIVELAPKGYVATDTELETK
jgi:hypothetical protein